MIQVPWGLPWIHWEQNDSGDSHTRRQFTTSDLIVRVPAWDPENGFQPTHRKGFGKHKVNHKATTECSAVAMVCYPKQSRHSPTLELEGTNLKEVYTERAKNKIALAVHCFFGHKTILEGFALVGEGFATPLTPHLSEIETPQSKITAP